MSNHSYPWTPDAPIEILLVEDNAGDVRLVQEAFETAERETTLRPVTTGEDALDRLQQQATDEPHSLPDLALVDLNLPGMDGCEFLETIRDDPRLQALPVIVFTSSDDSEDVKRCYDAAANAYLTKPDSPDEFSSLVEAVERFWFERAQLPPLPR